MKNLKINVPDGYEIDKEKSTFENIVFKKNELPNSWEELVSVEGYFVGKTSEIIGMNDYVSTSIDRRNIFKTKEQAKAAIALAQLSQLRDVYRQGWVPDWNDLETKKWCIVFLKSEIMLDFKWLEDSFLSFQDKETAEMFLENFRDLIEQAKPLMS